MANCKISAHGFGNRFISVPRIIHGISIVPNGEDVTRNGRVLYTKMVSSSGFTMEVQFTTHHDYTRFANWLQRYARRRTNPRMKALGPLRVQVPSVNFDKVVEVQTGITYGDSFGRFVHRMTLSFTGASDPVDVTRGFTLSHYRAPRVHDHAAQFFHPAGRQLTAGQEQGDVLYGIPEDQLNDWLRKNPGRFDGFRPV